MGCLIQIPQLQLKLKQEIAQLKEATCQTPAPATEVPSKMDDSSATPIPGSQPVPEKEMEPELEGVLIVDDSKILRLRLKSMIELLGHKIVGMAANGREALALVKMHHPKLVVLDHSMPVMDGLTFLKS